MAVLPSLRPNAPVTNTSITVVGAAVGWEAIDDDPDAPNVSDYVYDAGTTSGDLIVGLSDMPEDFSVIEGTTMTVRAVTQAVGFSDDSDTLTVELTDANGVVWSNTVTLSTQAHTTQALRTATLTLNGTATAAMKPAWDNARLHMLWTYSASMAKDNGVIRVYALEIDGNYVVAVDKTVVAPLLAAPATVRTPTNVARDEVLRPNLVVAPSTTHTPAATVGPVSVAALLLAAPATLRLATVAPGPAPPGVGVLLSDTASVFTPQVRTFNTVAVPLVTDTAVVFTPPMMWLGVDVTVEVPHLYV